MAIREKGYYNWDGELKTTGIRWLPIFNRGIKDAFARKWAKLIFFLTVSPIIVFFIGIYFYSKPELQIFSQLVDLLKSDAAFFNAFYTNGFSIFMLMVLCVFLSSELISGDLKGNAFPLYFSRPLDHKDYLLGKYSIILFYLLMFTLVGGILLLLLKFIFIGSIAIKPRVLLAIIIVPVINSLFFASLTMMVSSLSRNSKYVKVMLFLLYIFSDSIAQILNGIFHNPHYLLVSLRCNIQLAGAYLFDTAPTVVEPALQEFYKEVPGWMSLVTILVFTVIFMYILVRRIRRAEAQVDTSN